MKHLFIIALLLLSSLVKAQSFFNTKFFKKSKWATVDKDSAFFKADTLKLIKIIDDTYLTDGKSMDVDDYFKDSNYIIVEFSDAKELKLFSANRNYEYIKILKGQYHWQLNKQKKIMHLYLGEKLLISFVFLSGSKRDVEVQGKYMDKQKTKTIEITLLRNNFSSLPFTKTSN